MKLYKALELRGEFKRHINLLRSVLSGPEDSYSLRRLHHEPAFDRVDLKEFLRKLEFKARKLNTAIQRANHENTVVCGGEEVSIAEALETRKALAEQCKEAQHTARDSAYVQIEYKEERDIRSSPPLPFDDALTEYWRVMTSFRELNCALREVQFEVDVDFREE